MTIRIPLGPNPELLVLYLDFSDVAFAKRGSCTNCPIARALSRWMPQGTWKFDGEAARNPLYGTFWLPMHIGSWDFDTIAAYDAGAGFPIRILTLVRGDECSV